MSKFISIGVLAYVASVVILNIGFSYVPLIETPFGMLSPMALLAGAVFVLRDFAQRKVGHNVLYAMVAATVLSYILADPYVATVSAIAFAVSEIADYLIYSLTRKPFHQRILISSFISTPVDTAVFLLGIEHFTVGTFCLMVASKLVAAFVVWGHYKVQNRDVPIDANGHEVSTFATARRGF